LELPLLILRGRWSISRLPPDTPLPDWALRPSSLTVIARTEEELSIVAAEHDVPHDAVAERGFRVIKVEGPIPFHATGVIASLATPLASAGIAIFSCSTYDTDYVLVRETDLARAVGALWRGGWTVKQQM
jgi:hypothetical protein